VDIRVVGAVQEDIKERIGTGALRLDLYRRVAGVVVELPPLADRPEDVIPLAGHFAARRGQALEARTAEVLVEHSWPGNVRELRDAIDRAGCLVDNGTLPPAAVREAIRLGTTSSGLPNGSPGAGGLESFTRAGLVALCESCGWNAERIAFARGISRTTLFRQLRSVGVTLRGLRKYQSYANVRVPHGTLARPDRLADR
jgi:sigma-54 dependent transcriptional regulator, acetoin dehydrogenase operon transcriptional activator AcoR